MPGGRGANQAVQCSRLGLNASAWLGVSGNDIYGSELINSLRENNVSVEK
ncbi:PfkB family carbohydrate kinase [Klebsiella pneumoniae subsp. pneumoniae]|nr:PfkB family carbohydrate kinase [Klebsiella pneumoniae subsp. pneumoniae]